MKLKVTIELPRDLRQDVTLACDVTATVSDVARALVRGGVTADPHLEEIARGHLAPLTLSCKSAASASPLLLDPMSPIGSSGLQSGWIVTPVPEFGPHSTGERLVEITGSVEVLSGPQKGVVFSMIAGANLIGRDSGCRIFLADRSVSRRHAVIDVGDETVVRDLGSANGVVVDGELKTEHRLTGPSVLHFGDISVRVAPGKPTVLSPVLSHRQMHTRAPRIAPYFPQTARELPTPPSPPTPSRIPMLAMVAPAFMGTALFVITLNPMALMMAAFSPLMMIGSWVDGKLGGKRKSRRDLAEFEKSIVTERTELGELREHEIVVRATETPTLSELQSAIVDRDGLLWARRPEHRSFLEVRFGEGTLPSRTSIALPSRGEATQDRWEVLRGVESEFSQVAPVPVLERFDRCGSIGVSGDPLWAEGMARSLILQLVGLHSSAELVLACFAGAHNDVEWAWLKWLPHVDPVGSPLPVWQLADSEASSARLIIALEGLMEARRAGRSGRSNIRSHLDIDTRNDEASGDAVSELPTVPAVVVLVLDDGMVDPSRLIGIAEEGPDVGIHLIWVAKKSSDLPAACRTFVHLGQGTGHVNFVRSGTVVPLSRLEFVEIPVALDLARRLAPVEDTAARVLDESDLPKTVNLRELHGTDLLSGSGPIVQAWTATGTISSRWQKGQEREPVSLAAVVGQGPDGTAVIDLRTHGPHALVGGTTGAGKSEFLQTWIMSMATQVSPDRLSFLLIDYKGGAAFAECVDLPHTVGLVTDLSPHLVRRALTSLRAELHYREELLSKHGAKDLITMERRSDPAAPPVLIIVIDEFAALAGEVPEFVDGVIDVAQRGRSLGLHLVMATQRPAGVIKDNLRANTNLRIALRMADESDSSDVIGITDAAFFDSETPGRGAIKVGPGRISHFQTGYVGGRAGNVVRSAQIEVRSLGFTEGHPWDIPAEPQPPRGATKQLPDIQRLRDGIVAAALSAGIAAPRRPWLDELPKILNLAELQQTYREESAAVAEHSEASLESADGPAEDAPVIGLRDEPAAQAQHPVAIDFEEVGSISIIGAGGTGKTSALITLAASLSTEADRFPVEVYAIDAAGGALDALQSLPTVGAVASMSDMELVSRVLRRMVDVIAERGPRFAAARAGGLSSYRQTPGNSSEPRVFLMIDGFSAFRQTTETLGGLVSPFQMLNEIMMTGRAVGVHVVITSDRASAIPSAMASTLQQQYVFRLASPQDYGQLGLSSDALEEAPPGRALIAGDTSEIQFALPGGRGDLAGQVMELEALALELQNRGVHQVPEVVNAPEVVVLSELPIEVGGLPVYGIDTQTFEPVGLPLSGLGVIAGPPGSGQSTTVLTCVAAVTRWAASEGVAVDTVLLTFDSNGLQDAHTWDHVAYGEDAVSDLAADLVVALGGKPGRQGASGIGGLIGGLIGGPTIGAGGDSDDPAEEEAPMVFPTPGKRGVIVVERPADAEGTSALPHFLALAKAARRADVLVLFEFEQGTSNAIWDLFSALKQPSWGLALQPDDSESQTPFRESFGRVKRADFPPGRGFTIERGRVRPVHVATTLEESPAAVGDGAN